MGVAGAGSYPRPQGSPPGALPSRPAPATHSGGGNGATYRRSSSPAGVPPRRAKGMIAVVVSTRKIVVASLLFALVSAGSTRLFAQTAEPLRLHPSNPHYFLFRGKPTVLITSGEHYGSVLNEEFDYRKYLAALAADGMN